MALRNFLQACCGKLQINKGGRGEGGLVVVRTGGMSDRLDRGHS